ncbi:hypothetical protein DICPUDRAFT_35082 [Dictyostelium purpureum]|uniref:JmjC domain-containing protein n=1 Tax=Dictyostelium purpureum TaxID=5786 RepID=F0ZNT6_DICPU|nr:uncharacterized protein DICPUDRAFT_35082 [Dictyostelium purpureum]EGC34395.1 hypothetical protein DICPUDRAFT_35082 [Dictyostelium purpureum]|eukprot:XP_003289069.1 hypothetical protein DICPUDRAFT_35082 [Dictyostelium purpureum]
MSLKEEIRVPIFTLIKNCYNQTCQDLVLLNSDVTNQLSSDLKKLFYFYNKKQYNQIKSIYESIYKITWDKLLNEGSWNHICLREAFIMGQLAGASYYYTQNDFNKVLEILDLSFILGAPKEILIPFMTECTNKLKEQPQSTGKEQKEIPMVLDENINYSEFPKINEANQIPIITCNSTSINDQEYEKEFSNFKLNHLDPNKPCIIRGDAIQWSCINKWKDLNYFLNNYGNRLVPIELGHNKLYSKDKAPASAEEQTQDWSEKVMKLNEFIENFMVPSSIDSNSIKTHSKNVGYLAQHGLIEQLPSLLDDFKFPKFLQSTGDAKVHETEEEGISPHVWFGTGNTITPLHYDSYDNFLSQIVGYKYVRLYHPNMKPYLYVKEHDEDGEGSSKTAQNNISLIDIENPNLEKYPLFEKANSNYIETILKPGDMLFMPSGWWHYCRSLSPSFSLSFWFIKKNN